MLRRLGVMAAAIAVSTGWVATAKAEFIPPWIMGGAPGQPVIGVTVPPGSQPWLGPGGSLPFLTPFKVGCYFTRVRANNAWLRAQICDYM